VTVLLTGDMVLDVPGADHWLSGIAPALRSADLTVAHLEVPHTRRGSELAGDVPAPGADPDNLDALARAGVGMVSLAGNHIADCGVQGIADTVDRLERLGIAHTGAGATLAEASRAAVIERRGRRVALLSYNALGPEAGRRADRAGSIPTDAGRRWQASVSQLAAGRAHDRRSSSCAPTSPALAPVRTL
jgi:poly-gamma-glutamate synthesis protein (capsule biosynthesis protein)